MKTVYENFSSMVFPGFYESLLYNSDTLYHFEYGELPDGFCWEFVNNGYCKYTEAVCKEWVSIIKDELSVNSLNMKIGKFKRMWSPKEYNFMTDRISFEVSVNLNDLKRYCFKTRRAAFDTYLHKYWSSRDGFWSFIPNTVGAFEYRYKHSCNLCTKKDLIQIMIEWYLLESVDFEGVEETVLESQWELLSENVALQSTDDWSLWDYEYNDGYKPTKRIA